MSAFPEGFKGRLHWVPATFLVLLIVTPAMVVIGAKVDFSIGDEMLLVYGIIGCLLGVFFGGWCLTRIDEGEPLWVYNHSYKYIADLAERHYSDNAVLKKEIETLKAENRKMAEALLEKEGS